ncbi:MAG: translation initiation factor IF-3 [Chitinophagales bacterium]|nr:MAG: translation initiation factor IF-3 [Chitinophagales bacterium]
MQSPRKSFYRQNRLPKKQNPHKINEEITAPRIRLVGENIETGIYDIREARKIAEELGLDLVEVSPTSDPPVCKVMDYQKYLYEQKKKQKELRAKSAKQTVVKEVRFTPNTDEHDFEFKANHAEKFLKEGSKVKAFVQFKGRGILFKERGELMLLRLADRLKDVGILEQMPLLEGRRMIVTLAPKKK